jgi:hypothetical protein
MQICVCDFYHHTQLLQLDFKEIEEISISNITSYDEVWEHATWDMAA